MTGPAPTGPPHTPAGPARGLTGPAAAPPERPRVYSSPLPTPRPHLGHALASEWTKLVSVRSTLWTLGSLVVTVVGVGLLFIVKTVDQDYVDMPFTAPALFGLLVGQLAVMLLGVLTITSEHGTGLIRTTFTASPTRYRVLTAKYLVFGVTALLTTAGSVFVVGLAAQIVHSGPVAGPHPDSDWLGALAGCVYVTLLGVLALAVGSLVRHSAGAVAVMLGLVTLPPVIGGMLIAWEAAASVGETTLRYNAPVALMQLFGLSDTSGAQLPGGFAQMALILLVTGAAVAASYVVVGRQDT
ncbi:ABC transporter permease [Streptomyces sp. NPDC051567]|uniref:ABC transporter permease n=1 Tax=Streptomyces sp. NPDC051567 TaxID=3365660 RepID=UPI00379E0943